MPTPELPDVRALFALPLAAHGAASGIGAWECSPAIVRSMFDTDGLWWAVPFVRGASGCDYAFRIAPGPGHGAVLRCINGHAVTIASRVDRAFLAILAVERLLVGDRARARLRAGWDEARPVLREAVAITGGDPDELDRVLHVADALPASRSPAPAAEERARRAMLWRIAGDDHDEADPGDPIWGRANDSRRAPGDAAASRRLLQGNHGLDGSDWSAGLAPDSRAARELLVACATRVRADAGALDPAWAAVIAAIADRGQPEPADFLPTTLGVGPARAWEALAAASFWFKVVGGWVPADHAATAEEIAEAAGAHHVLAARRLLR